MVVRQFEQKISSCGRAFSKKAANTVKAGGRICQRIGLVLDPEIDGFPQTRTVVVAIVGLVVFIVVGAITVAYSNKVMLTIGVVASVAIEAVIIACVFADLREHGECDRTLRRH